MAGIRTRNLLPGVGLLVCSSLVPAGATLLVQNGHAKESVLAGMLVGAALIGCSVAAGRGERMPGRVHLVRMLALVVVGCMASFGYFQVVFELGAADADWIENALLVVLLVVVSCLVLGERLNREKWVGGAVALAGYGVFLWPYTDDLSSLLSLAVLWPILGASGSMLSYFLMKSLTRRETEAGGLGKFTVLTVRYSVVGGAATVCLLRSAPASDIDWVGFCLAAAAGGVLINGAVYCVLEVGGQGDGRDGLRVAMWMVGVPCVTTIFEMALGLHAPREPMFFVGAAIILLGLVFNARSESPHIGSHDDENRPLPVDSPESVPELEVCDDRIPA